MTSLALQTTYDDSEFAAIFGVIVLIYVAMLVVMIVAMVKVLHKAGYSGWWALTMFLPLVNVVMMLVFAFSDWPVLQRLRAAEQRGGGYGGYGGYPQQGYPHQGYPQQGYPQQGHYPQQ